MLRINFPDSPYSSQNITVNRTTINLTLKFNVIDESWYLDVKSGSGAVDILSGAKLTPNRNLTGRHLLPSISGGDIWCLRNKNTSERIGRDNVGKGKSYNLFWIPDAEITEAGFDGILQL